MGSFGDRFAKIAEVYGAAVTRLEVEWGTAPQPAAVRAAAAETPDLKAVLLTHNETSTGVTSDIAALAAAVREAAPDALILVDAISALGAVPFAMDDVGPGPRRHRVAEGVDGRAGHGDGGRRAARLGRRRDRDDAPLLPRPQAPPRRRPPRARPRGRPRSRCMYQVDEGLRLMQAEGDGVYRAPRGGAGDDAGRPPGARVRAPRGRRRRLEDGHRGVDPRDPRLEGVQRLPQAARPRARRRPGQAQGQDLPARPPRLGDDGRHPRRDRRPRAGRDRAGPRRPARARPSPPRSRRSSRPASGSRCPREDPRRRAARPGGHRPPPRATTRSTSSSACRARRSSRSCPSTTRSSSAARSRPTRR